MSGGNLILVRTTQKMRKMGGVELQADAKNGEVELLKVLSCAVRKLGVTKGKAGERTNDANQGRKAQPRKPREITYSHKRAK